MDYLNFYHSSAVVGKPGADQTHRRIPPQPVLPLQPNNANSLKAMFPKRRPTILATSVSALVAFLAGSSSLEAAAVNIFNGSGTDWSVNSDWTDGAVHLTPASGDDLLFNSGSVSTESTSTLNGSYTVQSLSFDIGANTLNINANASGTTAQTLTLNRSTGNDALGNPNTLLDLSSTTTGTVNIGVAGGVGITNLVFGTSGVINVSNASVVLNLGANSVISGTGSNILFSGAGTLTLAGTNTFGGTGSFFGINSGTVNINNASALGAAGNQFNIGGGTLDNTSGAAITTANYVQQWNNDFTFNGTNALNLGTGAVTLTTTPTITVNGTGANGTLTVGGVISGSSFGITKAGNGTLKLSGANTYTGNNTLNAGVLSISADNNLGAAPASPSAGNITFNGGTLTIATGALTLNVNRGMTFNAAGGTINTPAGYELYGGQLSGSGTLTLVNTANTGNAWLLYTGNSPSFSGNIVIGDGVHTNCGLQERGGGSLGTGTITVNAGGIMTADTTAATVSNAIVMNGGLLGTQDASVNYSGPVTLQANSTLGTPNGQVGGVLTLSNVVSGSGNLTKVGGDTAVLSAANTFTGSTAVTGGTLKLSHSQALQNSTLTTAGIAFDSSVASHAFTLGGLSGSGNLALVDNGSNPVALSVGNNGSSTVYSGVLSGAGSLTKIGNGTLTLTGANTHTGSTTVSGGTLELGATGSLVNSPVTVNAGTLQIDTAGNTLNSLIMSDPGAVLVLPAISAATTNVTGSFTQSANYAVTPVFSSLPVASATPINLLTAGSINGSVTVTPNFGTSRVAGTLAVVGNQLQLTITTGAANLVWKNQAGTGIWNLNTDQNFSNGGTQDVFKTLDAVTFDNSVTPGIVTLAGAVVPSSTTVSNTSGTYVFTGSGSIGGIGSLTKLGAGTLTVANANSYSGGTILNAGQLNLNNPSAIGTGALTLAGGTLDNTSGSAITLSGNNSQTWSGSFSFGGSNALNLGTGAVTLTASPTITVNGGAALTVGGVVAGSGLGLNLAGSGTLVLTGANTYSGGTSINGGTLQIGNGMANGTVNGTYSVASGARLYLNQGASPVTPTWANISGAGTLELSDAATSGVITYSTLALPAGFTGNVILDNRGRLQGVPSNLGGTSSVTLNNGAQFLAYDGTVNGTSYTYSQAFSINGLGSESGYNLGALRSSQEKAIFSGPITLTGNSGLFVQSNTGGALTTTGTISDGGHGYGLAINNQNTVGAITLAGTNTYTGPTSLNSGLLVVSGSISGSTTTVATGATLAGTGTTGPVTVNTGGNITAGATVGSIGTLNTGTLSLSGTYKLTLNSTTNQTDDLNVTGNLTLSGATLTLTDLALGTGNVNLTIAQFTGSLSGTFSGLAEGTLVDGGRYTIDYGIANPHAITLLTVVPEPGTYASLLGGLGMLVGLRRNRRRS